MEDKRLNFNRPILSARRFVAKSQENSRRKNEPSIPSLLPSPSCKSESHSGSLRNPGTVPFVWEQTPGRPKDETRTQKPPIVPKLPPGRILKPKKQDSDTTRRGFYVKTGPGKDSFENEKLQVTYGPNFLEFREDGSEDGSDFEYDEHDNMSFKLCGLLPQLCLKGSIGILNPTHGLSVRNRLPIPSAKNTRVGSAPAISQDAIVAANEQKSLVKHQNDQKNSHKLQQDHGITNNPKDSSSPVVSKNKTEVNIQKKGLVSFKELLAHENEKEADIKTLYVDTVHKVETLQSNIPTEPWFDLADNSKHDKQMITQTGVCKDLKVDQKVNASEKTGSQLPAPPPLPKSPSDSWLCRTLPSVNSNTASLWSNHKTSSKTTRAGQNVESHPQGLLLPIPET